MYSPKISVDLVPRIYRAAKEAGVAMTTWVNQAIERALSDKAKEEGQEIKNEKFRKGGENGTAMSVRAEDSTGTHRIQNSKEYGER